MKKEKFIKIIMILLPVMGMMLACTPNAVTVLDVVSERVLYTSFFVLVDGITMTLCFPLAGLGCGLSLAFSAARMIRQKKWMNKAILVTSFVATTLAVLPLTVQAEVVLLPNMLFPVMMAVEALLGYLEMKKQSPEVYTPRLKG